MNGFIVTLPSSTAGLPVYLVAPARPSHEYLGFGAGTDFVPTVWATQAEAQAVLDQMIYIHSFIAPEVNGGLEARLRMGRVVPTAEVEGVLFEAS